MKHHILALISEQHILALHIKYHSSTQAQRNVTQQLSLWMKPKWNIVLFCIHFTHNTSHHISNSKQTHIGIPSSIYFGADRKIYIGNHARSQAYEHNDYKNLIYDIKRIIGRSSQDPALKEFNNTHQFDLHSTGKYPTISIPNWSMTITPEQSMAAILYRLVQTASSEFGVPFIKDVVVSIPAIFHDAQRKAVHTACQIAGLDAKLLVVEPSAASAAYIYYAPRTEQIKRVTKFFMTLDVGGGTTDVSILRCTGLHCEVLGVAGNSSLGGIDFDAVVVDIMIEKVLKQNRKLTREKLSNMLLFDQIRSKAETVKKALSTESEYMVRLHNEEDGAYTQIVITRAEFEEHPQTVKLIDCIIDLAKLAMSDETASGAKKGHERLTNIRAV